MFVVVNQESFTLSFTFEIRCFVLQNPPQHWHMFFHCHVLSRVSLLPFSFFVWIFFIIKQLFRMDQSVERIILQHMNINGMTSYSSLSLEGSLVRRFQDISRTFCCQYLLQSDSSTSRSQDWTTPSTLPHRKTHCSNNFIIWWNSMMRCPISKNLRF